MAALRFTTSSTWSCAAGGLNSMHSKSSSTTPVWPCLANTTYPGECEQPRLVQRRGELQHVLASADEAGRLQWQIALGCLVGNHVANGILAYPST